MYMHELHIVHGGLGPVGDRSMKPTAFDTIVSQRSITINLGGRACLRGFGLSTLIGEDAHLGSSDPNLSDVNQGMKTIFHESWIPWTSPELLDWNYRPTKESDIYTLGMVVYQVRLFVSIWP